MKNSFIKVSIVVLLILSIFPFFINNEVIAEECVYLGGQVIGINISTNNLYITSKMGVITNEGIKYPCKNIKIKSGDILYSIDDCLINSIEDVQNLIQNKDCILLTIKRNNELLSYNINPCKDVYTNKYSLGLMIKNSIQGIGTVTFINKNYSYAALGHPIKDVNGVDLINCSGNIYNAIVNDIIKGEKSNPGEICGVFSKSENSIGTIYNSSEFGIFGDLKDPNYNLKEIPIGNKNEIKEGKAYIYSELENKNGCYYEIEIQKIRKQDYKDEKSMLIKVVDQNLLELTGGIVQGMSGSPIIQNGKLIGAVTHVLVSDSTKGYGIFIDWMR